MTLKGFNNECLQNEPRLILKLPGFQPPTAAVETTLSQVQGYPHAGYATTVELVFQGYINKLSVITTVDSRGEFKISVRGGQIFRARNTFKFALRRFQSPFEDLVHLGGPCGT